MSKELSRRKHVVLCGPTTGDTVRLADTDLFTQIGRDLTRRGDEAVFGGSKAIRNDMGYNSQRARDEGIPDTIITNAIIIGYTGVYKANVAVRGGIIGAIGAVGNPDIIDDVDIVIGASMEVIAGEHRILTVGGIDSHIHFVSLTQVTTVLIPGVTIMTGRGMGPADGANTTTIIPGAWHPVRTLQVVEDFPMNIDLLGRGHISAWEPLAEQLRAGTVGFKTHEDQGATHAVIGETLKIADEFDAQVTIRTNTPDERGFVEDTRHAIGGGVIHIFHTEGTGGSYAPDIITLAQDLNILPSSTNSTLSFTRNTTEGHPDMLMVCHHLSPAVPEGVIFAGSRIRPKTTAAEGVLHDLGVFSMASSDFQAMGRVGEVIIRTWQVVDQMKEAHGRLAGGPEGGDNLHIRRYTSKYAVNPTRINGVTEVVGNVEVGKWVDLVLWDPAFSGAKLSLTLKGGQIASTAMGGVSVSIPTPELTLMCIMFGGHGAAPASNSVIFTSQAAIDAGAPQSLGLCERICLICGIRRLMKADMVFNDATPALVVDPETYEVTVGGEKVACEPAYILAMT